MAKYAQIEDLKNGEIFRVVEETAGEVYFYDEFRRWCYYNKSEEGVNYRYTASCIKGDLCFQETLAEANTCEY